MNEKRIAAYAAAPKVDLLGKDNDRCDPNDPVLIPEDTSHDHRNPLYPSWHRLRSKNEDGSYTTLKPLIRCKCGMMTGIALHHVHADGKVTASFYDNKEDSFTHKGKTYKHEPGCGWHVFLKLDGYDQGEFLPED